MQPSRCWWAVAPGPAICNLSQALRDCSPHRSSELKPCLHLNKSLCSPFRRGRGCYKVSSTNFKEVRVTPRRKTCLNPTEGSMGACGCHGGRGSPCWGTYVVLLPTWLMGLSSAEKTRESLVTEAGTGQVSPSLGLTVSWGFRFNDKEFRVRASEEVSACLYFPPP